MHEQIGISQEIPPDDPRRRGDAYYLFLDWETEPDKANFVEISNCGDEFGSEKIHKIRIEREYGRLRLPVGNLADAFENIEELIGPEANIRLQQVGETDLTIRASPYRFRREVIIVQGTGIGDFISVSRDNIQPLRERLQAIF